MTPATSPLRLVVWGLGRHATDKILPAVAATEGLELYGVCSRDARTVSTSSAAWSCKGWTEAAPMLDDPKIDIVYVATPTGLHAEHAAAAIAAGKHVWCEKPLTSRLRDTLDLVSLSRRRQLSLCEGHMYLHHPQFTQLARYLSGGRIGRNLSVGFRFGIPPSAHPGFRTDKALGGGALLDVGSYPISALDALFPDVAREVCYARVSFRGGSSVDTDGRAMIELSNGVAADLEWRTGAAYRNEVDIWGDQGSLFADKIFSKPASFMPLFRLRDAHGVETTEPAGAGDNFVLMLRAFRDLAADAEAAERERGSITRRAELLEKIASVAAA